MGRRLTSLRGRAARVTGLVGLVVAVSVGAVFVLLPLAVQGLVRALDFTLNACLVLATLLSSGTNSWSIVLAIGREAGAAFMQTGALTAVGLLVVVGALALYGLQRLLGSEEE